MTKKLYDADSHLRTFTASLQQCRKSGDFFEVILDKTAFFPEGGGQYGDQGTLGGVKVIDTQINDSGVISHITKEALPVGETVTGEIDWPLRFQRMQSHSGEHIVSGLIHRLYHLNNIGFHLGDEEVTCDYDGSLSGEQLRVLEEKVNEAVFANLPVTVSYPSKDLLPTLDYRSKLDLTDHVRLVSIPGVDLCACCAPHVSFTGEIGLVKIIHTEKSHGGTRLFLRCGGDALKDYAEKQDGVLQVMNLTSSKQAEIGEAVEKLILQKDALSHALSVSRKETAAALLKTVPPTEENYVLCVPDADAETLRALALGGMEKVSGYFVALTPDATGYRYMIASKKPLEKKCKEINAALGGRGGGRDPLLQGSFSASLDCIRDYFLKA